MSDPNLLFVMGARKTGSTWLQTLLNHHPNILLFGEGIFHQFGLSLREPVSEYNLSLENKVKIFGERAFAPVRREEIVALFRAFVLGRLRHEAAERGGGKQLLWLGEKDPDHARYANLMFEAFPEASYVHILRDGRDVAVSWWHHMLRYDAARVASRYRNGLADSLVPSAKTWAATIRTARQEQQRTGVRYHELRYEDMVDRPEDTVEALLAFLDVARDPSVVAACIAKADFAKLSGGRTQGQEDKASFYRKGIKGDWRNHLDERQSRLYIEATEGLMRELGYV
jgi:hypothetical protein